MIPSWGNDMSKIQTLRKKYEEGYQVSEEVRTRLKRVEKNNLNSFITLAPVEEQAQHLQELWDKGERQGRLFGVPVGIKDNFLTKGLRTTCASRMLEDFVPQTDASLVKRLKEEGALILGKTNLDEFAMGSSGRSSYFGATKNPRRKDLVPGGSSSGSAAAVGGEEVLFALGSDTGDSVRQPSAFCGIAGFHPSYGTLSRYGMVSMASSMDQAGLMADSVDDLRTVYQILSVEDPKDPTMHCKRIQRKTRRLAVVEGWEEFVDEEVQREFQEVLDALEEHYRMDRIPVRLLYANGICYHILMTAEVSSNLSRYDGFRYGLDFGPQGDYQTRYRKNRQAGFGEEVKRRIALGTFYLSSKDHQKLYHKALCVRQSIREEWQGIFEDYDFVLTPTTTEKPYPLNRPSSPLDDYDSAIFNLPANLAGHPALTLPLLGPDKVSLQILGPRFADESLLDFGVELQEVFL